MSPHGWPAGGHRFWRQVVSRLVDTGAGCPLAELTGHTAVITSINYSPNGSTLASSSWDGTVRLWVEQ